MAYTLPTHSQKSSPPHRATRGSGHPRSPNSHAKSHATRTIEPCETARAGQRPQHRRMRWPAECSAPENAARCDGQRSALRCPMQCAAMAIACGCVDRPAQAERKRLRTAGAGAVQRGLHPTAAGSTGRGLAPCRPAGREALPQPQGGHPRDRLQARAQGQGEKAEPASATQSGMPTQKAVHGMPTQHKKAWSRVPPRSRLSHVIICLSALRPGLKP